MPEPSGYAPAIRGQTRSVPEPSGSAPAIRGQTRSVRIGRLADRQWGVVGRRQLLRCGLSGSAIDRWLAQGRLRRIHPGVYALGHSALREEARLTAALIYAGPGAVLSHASAAWWWQLVPSAPGFVQISALGDRGSILGSACFILVWSSR
jgi:hypothetical protein